MIKRIANRVFRFLDAVRSASATLTLRIGLCLAAMWAIFGLIVFETRSNAWNEAKMLQEGIATLFEATIAREFEVYDLSVSATLRNSTDPAILALPSILKRKAMFDQSASASDHGRLMVLDRSGHVTEASQPDVPIGMDYSFRDYFGVHRTRPNAGLYVGDPFISLITHRPSLSVSRRRVASDGSFDGVIVGTIQLSFFETLFSTVQLPPDSTIALIRKDGMLLTRIPLREDIVGRKVLNDDLIKTLDLGSGTYEKVAASDGINRLFAFGQIGRLPLYVSVGVSTREIFRHWRWEMLVIGTGFAILSALILLLGFNLRGELNRRGEAESRLAELASTDYLTLLANRRRFDEVLLAEWRRGARAGSPLSLLMVDGDFFKSFNDTYGHLEGDRVLRVIGAALRTCVDRPGDLVARYGGEEFAVLLPGTTGEGALMVASAIWASIDAMDLTHAAAPSGRLTVSIGVACRTPNMSLSPETLVEAADAALYLAKGEGRDRVVMDGRPASMLATLERNPLKAAS